LIYFGTRLSENISRREPEGYLICLNVPVARTGVQEYLPSELGMAGTDDRLIPVLRPEEEVFSQACIASFEGMPVTDDHPVTPDGVTAENSRFLSRGHAQHVRRGTGSESDLLLADLMITDPVLIDEILSGKREISCGYTYNLCEEDGKFIQREIRGNHVAVVDSGRAGPRVSIRDQEPERQAAAKLMCAAPDQPSSGLRGRRARGCPGPERRAAAESLCTTANDRPAPGFRGLPARDHPVPDHSSGRSSGAFTHGAGGRPGSQVSHGQSEDHFERSNPMKKKSLWRAKLMARMAKDGDVEGLAELITETMEEPAGMAVLPADPALPAADPLVSAVASAVAENLDPAAVDEELAANAAAGAPVVVETPTDQPVVVDCGPQILEALNRIISLLSGQTADCGTPNPAEDEDPSAVAEAVAETAAGQMAENVAAAAVEAVAETIDPDVTADEGEDPVEELVAEILEPDDPDQTDPVSDEEENVVSGILEPVEGEDEEEDPEAAAQAADALRAALASFRPQLKRMTPKQRQRFNADVAARMKRLNARKQARNGRPNAYAALRKASAHDQSDRDLGRKIMASRNVNLRGGRQA